MIVSLGADHAGFPLKDTVREAIEALGHTVIDCGTFDTDRSSPGKWCSDPSLIGQAVRAGRELVVTSSVLVSGTRLMRHRARTSRPR